jgi:putative transposase
MTIRRYHSLAEQPQSPRYASDLSDTEWAYVAPLVAQKPGSGRRRSVNIREVVNAIYYRNRTGCQWRMLPSDFPPWYHVTYYYYLWRDDGTWEKVNTALRRDIRSNAGRDPEPSTAIIDSQSREATEMGGEKGFDPHKLVKGRKRTVLVDTLGLLLLVVVCAASIVDTDIAEYVAREAPGRFPRLKRILADQGYQSRLVELFKHLWNCLFEIVPRLQETRSFTPHPQRWKVERTLGWFDWFRLLSKEYERTTESSEADIYIASTRLMLRRLPVPKK